MQVAIEKIVEQPIGLFVRARRKDEDGVEEVRWFGPFENSEAIGAWLVMLEAEDLAVPRTHSEVGLPDQLAQLADVRDHVKAAIAGKPKLALFRLDTMAARLKQTKASG